MSKLLITPLVAVAAMMASTAHAVVAAPLLRDPYVVSTINASYPTGPAEDSTKVYAEAFGTHTFGSSALTTIASTAGAPFIKIEATGSSRSVMYYINTELTYQWRITGAANIPVLVHIDTSGWLKTSTDYVPVDPADTNVVTGISGAVGTVTFSTYSSDGFGQGTYGLEVGPYNFGGKEVGIAYTDRTTASEAHFNKSFDVWVLPNMANDISLKAAGSYRPAGYFSKGDFEMYAFEAFIDPTITIDAAYAADYTLEQSYIPTASVAEPESYALFFAGLAMIGLPRLLRRKRGFPALGQFGNIWPNWGQHFHLAPHGVRLGGSRGQQPGPGPGGPGHHRWFVQRRQSSPSAHWNRMKNHRSTLAQSAASLLLSFALSLSANASSIVGSWSLPKSANTQSQSTAALTFLSNGTYIMGEDGDPALDASGHDGIELGTYSWDELTGAFSFQTLVDTSGEWGLSDSSLNKVAVGIDTLEAGTAVFDRITDSNNPIVGGWYAKDVTPAGGEVAISFLADGSYFLVANGSSLLDPSGQPGVERGTYTWNPITEAFTHEVLTDTNGRWGFSGANITQMSVQGNTLSLNHDAAFSRVSEVPEPQVWLLTMAGLVLTACMARRGKH